MLRTSIQAILISIIGTSAFADGNDGTWTGFYLGAQYSAGSGELLDAIDLDYDAIGLHGGYLYDFGTFVVGAELMYSTGEFSSSSVGLADVDTTHIKAIAGYDLGQFLPYLTAGSASFSSDDFGESVGFFGVGGSYAVSDSVRLGLEYIAYEDFSEDFDGLEGTSEINLRASFAF